MAKSIQIDERFSTAELAAIGKIAGKNNGLTSGDHSVDVMLHVSAIVRKGEDYERTPTASIPTKKVLALFVRYSGVTRDAALAVLERAMTDALNNEIAAEFGDLEAAEEKVIKTLGELPKVKVSGATTVHDLVVDRIEQTITVEAGNLPTPHLLQK